MRRKVRVLVFAAAPRTGPFNRKLARIVSERLTKRGADVDHADFREFEMPMYDGDLEAASELPPGARRLLDRIVGADAFAISSPEYNFSLADQKFDAEGRLQDNKLSQRLDLVLDRFVDFAEKLRARA